MKLTNLGLKSNEWKEKGYHVPTFNREAIIESTKKEPVWVHFGAGNIFRGFPARLQQHLIEEGITDKGIIVAEGFDYEIIDDIYNKFDNLTLLVTLKANGSIEKDIISSVTEAYAFDYKKEKEWNRFKEIFTSPSLQMVSFTITEKGYSLKNAQGEYMPLYEEDFLNGPGKCNMMLSKLTELLLYRYRENKTPIAFVSMDNCSHNGEKLENAITTIASEWVKNGKVEASFLDWIKSKDVSFPWSMIDKITPRPDSSVASILEKDGYEEAETVITSKHTYISSFVNAEEAQYLVIEDDFPNGRPMLEKSGVYFTDRETVNKVEKMKVCTCLNPLHTALAIFGCLLGYERISSEMKDEDLVALIKEIGYKEGLPVVVDPLIINPRAFIDEVISVRLPNPFMPDTPQRIATDTSQKLAIRFGETIKAYIEKGLDLSLLKNIPLVFAAWLRYLLAIDDDGNAFALSPDPLLEYAQGALNGIGLGYTGSLDKVKEILSNSKIFGVDLFSVGLGERTLEYFKALIAGKGAIRKTLHSLR